ncbi:LytTR family DNA-binding domain-containing protein [Emticicia sp. W12TSBA100-4]|uniref:LytR/AlgR family response regulator transcription factor n=1 Tax=Emticicia sp. W12TSBA100-4 TaxID=3160965 RepID=UPI0033065EDA
MENVISIGSRTMVSPSEVVYFVADSNYTHVHFKNGDKILVATNLKIIEDRFANCKYFFRPNRSFFINLNFAEFEESCSMLKIKDQASVLVSRRRKPLLINALIKSNLNKL